MFKCWQTAVLSFGFHEKNCVCGKNLRCFICAACGKKSWGFCFRRLRRKFWGLLFMQHETAGGNQPERALGLRLGFWVVSSLRYMIYIYTWYTDGLSVIRQFPNRRMRTILLYILRFGDLHWTTAPRLGLIWVYATLCICRCVFGHDIWRLIPAYWIWHI